MSDAFLEDDNTLTYYFKEVCNLGKVIKCKFCEKIVPDNDAYASHMEKKHRDMIPSDMTTKQFLYYLRTGREHGNCVMCKSPTDWNEKTGKYHRFCDNPKCKEEYIRIFRQRMMDKYGKVHLLDDAERQRIMLARRKISKIYHWSDRVHVSRVIGSYEYDFINFLDVVLSFDPEDIITPSPHNYFYTYENKRHFYFPDVYIPSLNLEIEIKDGGDNPNMHPKIQAVDKEKERLKDKVMSSPSIPMNYLKVTNKNHMMFIRYLDLAKEYELKGITKKIILI